MADEPDSEESKPPSTPSRRRVRWRKNAPTTKVEVLALGPRAAAAYAAQKERARKKRADTSTDESTSTEPRE